MGLGLKPPIFLAERWGQKNSATSDRDFFAPHFFAKLPWVCSAFLPGLCGVKGWGACTEGCTAETGHHAEFGASMNLFCTTLGPEIMGSRPPSWRKKRHSFSGNSPTQNTTARLGPESAIRAGRPSGNLKSTGRRPRVTLEPALRFTAAVAIDDSKLRLGGALGSLCELRFRSFGGMAKRTVFHS